MGIIFTLIKRLNHDGRRNKKGVASKLILIITLVITEGAGFSLCAPANWLDNDERKI